MTPMQQQYQRYPPQPPGRSPHASARRGPGPMVSGGHPQAPQMTPAQMQQQVAAAAQKSELAKRRSRKPTDKSIPDGVEELIIGDGVQRYKELRDVERRLDAAMMRKRLDIQDSVNRTVKRYKTLRVWISNTAENQPWQQQGLEENAFDFNTGDGGSYRVKIEGRLLDDDDIDALSDDEDESEEGTKDTKPTDAEAMEEDGDREASEKPAKTTQQTRKRLSHFFRGISVTFPNRQNRQDPMPPIEWKKPSVLPNAPVLPAAADFDCLEFERKSDENLNCIIQLVRDEHPERYKLSPELAEVLDTDEDDRAGVVMGIWEYIKAMNLQEDEEKRGVRCDERLRAVFKQETLFFPTISDLINPHLKPLPPLSLPYTIRVDPAFQSKPEPTIYDILVPLEDPLRLRMNALLKDPLYPSTLRQLASMDDQLALLVQAISHAKAKHGFFKAASTDPVMFMRRWIGSQKRDLETLIGEGGRGGEVGDMGDEWRRGGKHGVWGREEVQEAVGYRMAKGF